MLAIDEEQFDAMVFSSIDNILLFDLQYVLSDYEAKIFSSLAKKEYEETEKYLSELCFSVLDLSDEEQVFIMRIYFTSIVTEIIRIHTRTNRLHPERFAYSQAIIIVIESWENISEFILSIPWFVNKITSKLIMNTAFMTSNPYVEKVISLIALNIEEEHLSVHWLAKQLNISKTHLSNLFKIHTNETVSKYIKRKRIDQIIFDIKYTNLSLKKIRSKYGFKNHSHFIRYFKEAEGKTPLAYKQEQFK